MGKILRIIGQDGFEIVRDRIGAILNEELATQAQLTYSMQTDAEVTIENTNPEDQTMLPVVNVSVAQGVYDSKDYRSVKGSYKYYVDCYAHAKTNATTDGSYLAAKRVHKLVRLCRSILNDPIYKTLGLKPPFIYRVYISQFDIGNLPAKNDTVNSVMGRITFNVEVNEDNTLLIPELIEGYETTVNIGNSSLGYFWEGQNY